MGIHFHLLSRLVRIALVACAAGGCAYQPGAFSHRQQAFPGSRATVGCLDIAVERRGDLAVGPVLGYQFANRCDRALTIDLGAVAVVGRDASGADVRLAPYDPGAELHAAALDGRSSGGEALAYVVSPASPAMLQVCVDVATLAMPVPGEPARWLCFAEPAPALGHGAIGGAP
jgi:hypothetical protein